MEKHSYEVNVEWTQGRKGILSSPELNEIENGSLEVATPPQFPGGIAGIWSPEHLFTAAVSSCLMTTFLAIAENSGLEFTHFSCKSYGELDSVDGKLQMSRIILKPLVVLNDEEKRAKAERVLQKAEKNCLISNSVNSEVIMIPEIQITVNLNH